MGTAQAAEWRSCARPAWTAQPLGMVCSQLRLSLKWRLLQLMKNTTANDKFLRRQEHCWRGTARSWRLQLHVGSALTANEHGMVFHTHVASTFHQHRTQQQWHRAQTKGRQGSTMTAVAEAAWYSRSEGRKHKLLSQCVRIGYVQS